MVIVKMVILEILIEICIIYGRSQILDTSRVQSRPIDRNASGCGYNQSFLLLLLLLEEGR